MCVICYKSVSSPLPKLNTIEEMWDANSHGAGVMWRENKNSPTKYEKGFMKYQDFANWFWKNKTNLEPCECAFHFRITTHGGTRAGNCHPFPIGNGIKHPKNLHQTIGISNNVMMHNGVLPITPRCETISDTGEMALRLSKFKNYTEILKDFGELITGNRLLIFPKNHDAIFIGEWKTSNKEKSLLFSNLNWVWEENWALQKSNYDYNGFAYNGFEDDYPVVAWDAEDGQWINEYGDVLQLDEITEDMLWDDASLDEYYNQKREGKKYAI